MARTRWSCVGVLAIGACAVGGEGSVGDEERERVANSEGCDELGYRGVCLGEVSLWYEDRSCRVRDCGGEGKTCGLISEAVGFGCLEGTQGSTVFDCDEVGYEGACLSGDVLVWTESASCRWADCGGAGMGCGWTDAVGYDCIEGGGGGGSFVVAGVTLEGNRAKWVRHIRDEIVPRLRGSKDERVETAAVVAWWALKEGVLDLDDALAYSNCTFPPDRHIGPVEECPDPDNAWQVGISGVQAAWRSLDDVEAIARDVYPDLSTDDVLRQAARAAGFADDSDIGRTIVQSTDRLRLSWLLRDGAVGFEAQDPVVTRECFDDAQPWCFGSGWDTSEMFAADRSVAERAIADLRIIFADEAEPDPEPPVSGDLLTVGEIVGGADFSITQDYGPTDFDYNYDYCWSYGVAYGSHEHCGVDIGIPVGTPLYVPGDGTVLIAGESTFFEDVTNPAAGELKIRLDHDGTEVILGHMTRIDLATNQRVTAGEPAGLSGSQNGPHVHIEVRVPDAAIGLRTVDPMEYFGG